MTVPISELVEQIHELGFADRRFLSPADDRKQSQSESGFSVVTWLGTLEAAALEVTCDDMMRLKRVRLCNSARDRILGTCDDMKIESNSYGKQRVRVTYVDRSQRPHHLVVCSVGIRLEGDFEASYSSGDNRQVVATDSMKNTVYVLAREHGVSTIERFATLLARHFLGSYEQVERASVEIEAERWQEIESVADEAAGTAFHHRGGGRDAASAIWSGDQQVLRSGILGLQVLKTANSGFSDFHRDRFTTLADTDDRLFATTVRAWWRTSDVTETEGDEGQRAARDRARRSAVRRALLRSFAEHHSRSVQETLHSMGEAVLAVRPEIEEIELCLPNQHHLLVDLSPFELDNPNVVFVGTDEPYGNIEATLKRP